MSLTEMTLSIYRHLTNFVKFLMNIKESVNLKIPLRIVLLKECHHFDSLDLKIFPEERYFKGEERLVETVQKLLNPPLRIVKRETVEKPHGEGGQGNHVLYRHENCPTVVFDEH